MRRRTDDDFDENGILKDRRSVRIPMRLMDSRSRPTVHDGRGGPVGHRPGFLIGDNASKDEREHAYEAYDEAISSAYRQDAVPAGSYPLSAGEGNACTVNGQPGTLVPANGFLVCKPNESNTASDERRSALDERDFYLQNAWRGR